MGLKEFIAMSFVIYCALFIALCLSGFSDYKSINWNRWKTILKVDGNK